MRRLLYLILSICCVLYIKLSFAADIKEIGQDLSDSVITTKITAKFTKNVDLNPLKISVTTHNGVVTLRGNVKNKQAFIEALRLAVATQGVRTVDVDNLEIKQVNTALTDAYITAKVETAILKAKVLDDESIPLVGINATTTNGVVMLTGQVKNGKSIIAILNRVQAVRGVKKVISKLETNAVAH